ncbi:MAG: hydrogenase, partial [Thermoanaerobaculia bacterium]|nr:hydrogenase [Thermoanaerobaculia bacterium]
MTHPVDILLVLVILLNFLVLGTPSLRMTIRGAALQGTLLALLPLLVHRGFGWRVAAIAVATMALKGLLIPGLLEKAMRDVHIRKEVEPYVGFVPSLFLCGVGTALAILFSGNLPLAPEHAGTLLVPASLATLLSGFLVLTTRKKAISQVVGYLILENGIFIFGQLL